MGLLDIFKSESNNEDFSLEDYLSAELKKHKGEKYKVQHIDFHQYYINVFLDMHPTIIIPMLDSYPSVLFTLVNINDELINEGESEYSKLPLLYNKTANCYFFSELNDKMLNVFFEALDFRFDYTGIRKQIKISNDPNVISRNIKMVLDDVFGPTIDIIKSPLYILKGMKITAKMFKLAYESRKNLIPIEFDGRLLDQKDFLMISKDANGNKVFYRRYYLRFEHSHIRKHFYCFYEESTYKDKKIELPPVELNTELRIIGELDTTYGHIYIKKLIWGNKKIIKKGLF